MAAGSRRKVVLTLDDLEALGRSAEPVGASFETGTLQAEWIATFEGAAGPYRTLLRSARLLLLVGRSIGPELELELRRGANALWRIRQTLGAAESGR
jgi:hypothetical protein